MKIIPPGSKIGIIGGGHLARMIAQAAFTLGYKIRIFCPYVNSPASQLSNHVTLASYDDEKALKEFAENVDIITFENEEVPNHLAKMLSQQTTVMPRWNELKIAYNRLKERQFLHSVGVPISKFFSIDSKEKLEECYFKLNCQKAIYKALELTPEGKSQVILEGYKPDFDAIWNEINISEGILEPFVEFEKELSVIIARGYDTKYVMYDVSEYENKGQHFHSSIAPAYINCDTKNQAYEIANIIASQLRLVGVLTVEFFMLKDGSLLVNEITPRPNETGYWTQDGCLTSHFEQLIRAICGLPLGAVNRYASISTSLLTAKECQDFYTIMLSKTNNLYLYGKLDIPEDTIMGHVNTTL